MIEHQQNSSVYNWIMTQDLRDIYRSIHSHMIPKGKEKKKKEI